MELPIRGGCLCGAVRYTLTLAPNYVYFCHCLDCQKESGSPFVTDMNVGRTAVHIDGPLSRHTRTGESGKSIHRFFCTACGTTLYTKFDIDPEHVSIKACSLDDPSTLKPDRHLFWVRKQPWLHLADNLTVYDRDCD
jgi:hypothetical protein